jgi:cell division protein FtsB
MANPQSDNLIPPTNSDQALHSVQRSNKIISISTVVALVLIVAMLGFALIQLSQVVSNQQAEIKAAADRNANLTKEVQRTTDKQLKAIADYLECIAKTNPNTRTNAEVDACLNILRKGGEVSYFLGQPKPKVMG